MNPGEAALDFVARGWPVFPVEPRGKRPLGRLAPHGFHDATTDPAQVRAWWGSEPRANVGIRTGAPFADVLDMDPRHGGDRTLADLVRVHGPLPVTPSVLTGSGGRHVMFSPDSRVRCSPGRLGAGLDVRGTGGYVVAPPSIHPCGDAYEWSALDVPLAPWPAWLLTLILPEVRPPTPPAPLNPLPDAAGVTPYGRAVLRRACEAVEAAGEGRRHEVLKSRARVVGGFVAGGALSADVARDCLIAAGMAVGLSEREARDLVGWGLLHGATAPLAAPTRGRG